MISVYTVFLFFPVVVLGLLFWPVRVVWGYVVLRRHDDGPVYAAFSRRAGFVFLGLCVVGYALLVIPFVARDAMPGVTRFLESGRSF